MPDIGKSLIFVGLGIALFGLLVWGASKAGFRGLPGDFHYEGQHTRFYFPIVTCIVVSALLTAISWIWNYFSRK